MPSSRRGPRWERLGRGVAIPSGLAGEARFWASLTAWADRLPADSCFTGLTAARIWGLWVPPLPADHPLAVAVVDTGSHVTCPQLAVTRHRQPVSSVSWSGVEVATIEECLIACARGVCLLDLIVLVDSALQKKLTTLDRLTAAAAQRRRGAPLLRRALQWADGRSESPWETLLRVMHVACGIAVEPQVEIRDAGGNFLGRADLLVVGTNTLQEYDGDGHFKRGQYGRDRRRESGLSKNGYVRNGWVAHEVIGNGWRILREAAAALQRDLRPTDLKPWWELFNDSYYNPNGTKWAEEAG